MVVEKVNAMKVITVNKKARFNYEIIDKYEAGIALKGTEVKSVRAGKVNIRGAYGIFKGGELFLIDMHISPYSKASIFNHDPTRPRKLLLHKRQLIRIAIKVNEKGVTIVPLRLYFNDSGKLKVEIGLARGKKLYDKREVIAKREAEREKARAFFGRGKKTRNK